MLSEALANGAFVLGQVQVSSLTPSGVEVRHVLDTSRPAADLQLHEDPEDAAEITRYTGTGEYRPLKGAPNLRPGWRLVLPDLAALRLALDLFYPGRLGAYFAYRQGALVVTDLRETLGRQSGMYRVTQKLTDNQVESLIGRFCRSEGGCLRTILWKRDAAGALPSAELPPGKYEVRSEEGVIPLLCQEACNLLVAEARRVVKG